MKKENEEIEAEIVETAPVLKDIKYPVSMVDIDALLEEYAEVPEIDPESEEAAEQYQFVLKGHKRFVKARTSIEKTRKELKAPALEYGKKVDEIAKEFQAKIAAREAALQVARKTVEDHEQRKLEEAEEVERQRIAMIESKITDIRNLPLGLMGCKSDTIKDVVEKLMLPTAEEFEEFYDKAIDTYRLTMSQLESAYETTIKAEQADKLEAERQKREAEERAEREAEERRKREEFEAEQAAFHEEQRLAQEAIRLQQEEINRQNAEREAEELQRRQEAERIEHEKQQEEQRKIREAEQEKTTAKQIKDATKAIEKMLDDKIGAAGIINEIISNRVPNVKWVPNVN